MRFAVRVLGALGLAVGLAVPAQAMTVRFDEARVEQIFSGFNGFSAPIDIRQRPVETLVRPDLVEIETPAEWSSLSDFARRDRSVVHLAFVQDISWCGAFVNAIGCANVNGNLVAVDPAVNRSFGGDLVAHELSHNLGLRHTDEPGNLMNPIGFGESRLNPQQVAIIETSPLIKTDAGGRYIDIQNILITEAAVIATVPLPASAPALASVLVLGVLLRRRRARVA